MHNSGMRTLFYLSLSVLLAHTSFAQTPAPPAPQAPAAPAAPVPRRAPAPAPASRSGIALTVTDARGLPISGVRVTVAGQSDRSGETNDRGQANFVGMQAGTYRLRFDGDNVITFEREVTVRSGQPTSFDVMLNPAPPPPAAPPPPPPATQPQPSSAPVGPIGQPGVTSVLDVLDKQFVGKAPRRDTLIACSGNTRTMLIQLNEPLPERLYEAADAEYYVVGGEGTARIAGREMPILTSSTVSVPRGTRHSFAKKGNRPLILLSVLGGEPCEQAK
jgi:Carboxypeptidase regulatory-like domain